MEILLVDDSVAITSSLSQFLRVKQHNCTVSNSSPDGLELILEKKFDVIIMDYQMPEMTGLQVLEKLKEQKIDLRNIVILSGSNIEDTEKQYMYELGIGHFIKKPVSPSELLFVLQTMKQTVVVNNETC